MELLLKQFNIPVPTTTIENPTQSLKEDSSNKRKINNEETNEKNKDIALSTEMIVDENNGCDDILILDNQTNSNSCSQESKSAAGLT